MKKQLVQNNQILGQHQNIHEHQFQMKVNYWVIKLGGCTILNMYEYR